MLISPDMSKAVKICKHLANRGAVRSRINDTVTDKILASNKIKRHSFNHN